MCLYFNPRAPCGARPAKARRAGRARLFQSTRPLRGATRRWRMGCGCLFIFQSTRPLRGATAIVLRLSFLRLISIHAPLAGRDRRATLISGSCRSYFNPRAPCGARQDARAEGSSLFCDFNPRAPCGARLQIRTCYNKPFCISIHAPLAGRDSSVNRLSKKHTKFQSTRPLRGATSIIIAKTPTS